MSLVRNGAPDLGPDRLLGDLKVLLAVHVPAHRLGSLVGAVNLERVRVERLLGHLRRRGVAREARRFLARASGVHAAVHGAKRGGVGVDVLHNVKLAGVGPVTVNMGKLLLALVSCACDYQLIRHAPAVAVRAEEKEENNSRVVTPKISSQRPERRPVSNPVLAHIRQLQAALDPQLATGLGHEVCLLRLDTRRCPGGSLFDGRDFQGTIAGELAVGRVGGICLDLAGTKVFRAAWV